MMRYVYKIFEKIVDYLLFEGRDDLDKEQYHYQFSQSMKELIPSRDTPLAVLWLLRSISENLDISLTQVEIIILISTEKTPIPLSLALEEVTHVSRRTVRRNIHNLCKEELIVEYKVGGSESYYGLSQETVDVLKSYNME